MKNTIKLILLPIIYSFASLIVSIFLSLIYVRINTYFYGYNTKEQLNEYFNSDLYKIGINEFLTNNYIYIGIIVFALFIPYLLKKYHTENKENKKLKFDNYLLIVILGMLVAGISTIIFYLINNIHGFTTTFNRSEVNLLHLIIVSGILLPILEEYMFRGVIYNNLQKDNEKMLSIITTSILFGVISSTIDGMIYSFALSFLLIYVYEKYKTLKAPIILHITSSIFIILFVYIVKLSVIVDYILLIIFMILLILYYLFVIRKDLKVSYGKNNKRCKG